MKRFFGIFTKYQLRAPARSLLELITTNHEVKAVFKIVFNYQVRESESKTKNKEIAIRS